MRNVPPSATGDGTWVGKRMGHLTAYSSRRRLKRSRGMACSNLKPGGRLIVPVGPRVSSSSCAIRRRSRGSKAVARALAFVPAFEWHELIFINVLHKIRSLMH